MNLFYTQEKAKEELERQLSDHNVVLLYGNSGTGKSSLAKFYAEECHGSEIIITEYSNNSYRNSPLQTLKLALSRVNIKNIDTSDDVFLGAVAQDLPVGKHSLTYVINRFKNRNLNKFESQYFNIFNESEKIIIMKLAAISKKSPLLLIFDNYHWANINDTNFVNNLLEISDNRDLFRNPVKIILVVTINQHENPDFNFRNLQDSVPNVNLNRIAVEQYGEILNKMGLSNTLTGKAIEAIYSLTSGHLELTKRVVDYINTQSSSFFDSSGDMEEQAVIMMADIFDQMIKFSFKDRQDTIDILAIASVIGNIFNRYELKALTQEELFQIENQLSNAAGEHFIEMENDKAHFIHPIIRELFYKKLDDKRYSYHKKYAAELKILKPTEHLERAYHLEKCRDDAAALQESIIAYYFSILSRTHFPDSVYQKIIGRVNQQRLENYFSNMEKAFHFYCSGHIKESLDSLEQIDEIDITTELYSSIKKYLYARNLLLYKYDTESFTQSADLLKSAKQCFYQQQEFELYISSLMILLNIYAYKLCDINAAKEVEKQIIDLFHHELHGCIDPRMDEYRYEYKRKSSSICTPEIACKRTREALDYFNDSDNVMERYKSACDHSATCIFSGEFQEALKALEVCRKTVEDNSILSFPETFKPQNNYILALLYSNPVLFQGQIGEAINAYHQILDQNPYITRIIDVNLTGLLLLDGQLDEAESRLKQLKRSMSEYKSVFYSTFIYSNIASLYILRQDYDQALEYLYLVEDHLNEWGESIRRFYKKQADILKQIALNREQLTPYQLFMRPAEVLPEYLGSTWKFIGRGILFSELLFYTT